MNTGKKQPDSPFDRLPKEVQEEILAKRQWKEEDFNKAEKWLAKRRKYTACTGVFLGLFFPLLWEPSRFGLFFVLLSGICGGVSAFLIIKYRIDPYLAGAVFAGPIIFLGSIGYGLEYLSPDPFTFFFSWLFIIAAGMLISIKFDLSRNNNINPF